LIYLLILQQGVIMLWSVLLHVTARKYDEKQLGGHSDRPVSISSVKSPPMIFGAVNEAMTRLRAGEKELAIHHWLWNEPCHTHGTPRHICTLSIPGSRSSSGRLLLLPLALVFGVFGFS
jgi:hypothetical protein